MAKLGGQYTGEGTTFRQNTSYSEIIASDSNGSSRESSAPNKYKLPYGLAKGLGLSTKGMTPTQVWDMLKGKGISPQEEYEKLGENSESTDEHEQTGLQGVADEPSAVDEETEWKNEEDEDKFSQERKDAAIWCKSTAESKAVFGSWQKEVYMHATKKEWDAAYQYTQGSGKFNKPLRGYTDWGKDGYKGIGNVPLDYIAPGMAERIKSLTDMIEHSDSPEDCWLQRGVNYDGAKQLLGLTGQITVEKVQKLIDLKEQFTDNGFSSCGAAKSTGFTGLNVTFNIYAPKGTKMLYVEGNSAFNGENEMVLQRGTTYRATKVSKGVDGSLYIDLEVFAQNPIDLDQYKK